MTVISGQRGFAERVKGCVFAPIPALFALNNCASVIEGGVTLKREALAGVNPFLFSPLSTMGAGTPVVQPPRQILTHCVTETFQLADASPGLIRHPFTKQSQNHIYTFPLAI